MHHNKTNAFQIDLDLLIIANAQLYNDMIERIIFCYCYNNRGVVKVDVSLWFFIIVSLVRGKFLAGLIFM